MNQGAADFFANLPNETDTEPEFKFMEDATEKDKTPEVVETKEPEHVEKDDQERKKPLRAERREQERRFFEEKLQEEREARIRMEEQLKALSQGRKIEADPDIKRLLTETKDPEEATQIFESLIAKAEQRAEQRAYERMQELQTKGNEEVNAIHQTIERSLEAIEDRYGVDLTDDTETRNKFLDFVSAIAPEDSDELPNMRTAWQLFQATQKAGPSATERKGQVSTRSMTRSVQNRPVPEGKNLQPMSFDSINRGNFWDKVKSGFNPGQ